MKPKGKSKWSPQKTNKAGTTNTRRTRLENKAAEIKTQTMRQTIYIVRNFAPYACLT